MKHSLPADVQNLGGTLFALALLALSACTTGKVAYHNTRGERFTVADVNHDGKLTRVEASDFLVGDVFDSRDKNHDGKLTEKEWVGGDPARLQDFKTRDVSNDGIVTRDEALAYGRSSEMMNKIFGEADINHDGFVTREEAQIYYASRE